MAKKKEKSEKRVKVEKTKVAKLKEKDQSLPTRVDDMLGQPFLPAPWKGFFGNEDVWAPAIHVIEKEDKFIAKVELPGVHEDDLSVSILGDMLVVEGEKQSESEVKKKGFSYSETAYGSFSRSISIPSIVDAGKISANFDKGILEIDLPKNAEVQPKKVSVTTEKKAKKMAKEEPAAIDAGKESTEK